MHSVSHFELPYDNPERAKGFYSQVFGWQIQDIPEMNYTMVTTSPVDQDQRPTMPGTINGGLMPREGTGKLPVIVVSVPSITECISKVEETGGSVVMEKKPIGEMGYYARVKDTEGNIIGIWETRRGA